MNDDEFEGSPETIGVYCLLGIITVTKSRGIQQSTVKSNKSVRPLRHLNSENYSALQVVKAVTTKILKRSFLCYIIDDMNSRIILLKL